MLLENLQDLDKLDSIKWISLSVAILLMGVWFYMQNKHFDYRSQSPSRSDYITLLRAARIRSTLINLMLWGFFASFFIYEFSLNEQSVKTQKTMTPIETIEEREPEVSPIRVDSIPNPDVVAPVEAPVDVSAPQSTTETQLDAVKERYEDVFVSYLYLKRCEKADDADYPAIVQAFQDEASAFDYDPSLFQSVYDAAEGSYSAIYRDSKCDDATLLPVLERFKIWLDETVAAKAASTSSTPVAPIEPNEVPDVATN